MNNIILVAVTQRFEDLSHVVTVKENAVFLGVGPYATPPRCTRHKSTALPENNSEGRTGYRERKRVLSENLNRAIKACLVTHVMILQHEDLIKSIE